MSKKQGVFAEYEKSSKGKKKKGTLIGVIFTVFIVIIISVGVYKFMSTTGDASTIGVIKYAKHHVFNKASENTLDDDLKKCLTNVKWSVGKDNDGEKVVLDGDFKDESKTIKVQMEFVIDDEKGIYKMKRFTADGVEDAEVLLKLKKAMMTDS